MKQANRTMVVAVGVYAASCVQAFEDTSLPPQVDPTLRSAVGSTVQAHTDNRTDAVWVEVGTPRIEKCTDDATNCQSNVDYASIPVSLMGRSAISTVTERTPAIPVANSARGRWHWDPSDSRELADDCYLHFEYEGQATAWCATNMVKVQRAVANGSHSLQVDGNSPAFYIPESYLEQAVGYWDTGTPANEPPPETASSCTTHQTIRNASAILDTYFIGCPGKTLGSDTHKVCIKAGWWVQTYDCQWHVNQTSDGGASYFWEQATEYLPPGSAAIAINVPSCHNQPSWAINTGC